MTLSIARRIGFTLAALLLSTSGAMAQQARNLTGDAADGSDSIFRGSTLVYENYGTAVSVLKSAEPMWNPNYSHMLSLRPEWHFSKSFFARARLNINQELTQSDDFNSAHEIYLSDMQVELVAPGWTEPNTKVRIGGNLRLVAPTSKASQAATLYSAVAPGVTATRSFELLEGVVLGYSVRGSKSFFGSTTPVMDGPRIPCVDVDSSLCARFSHNGNRNVSWSITHGPLVVVSPTEALSLTLMYSQIASHLFDLTPASVETSTGTFVLDEGNGMNMRWSGLAALDATYTISKEFSLALGAYTWSSQLGPDGQYRNPFVNRFTSLYLDLIVDAELFSHRFK